MQPLRPLVSALLLSSLACAAEAQSVCTSDDTPQAVGVLERFINADCDACWRDAKTPVPAANELALDWIVPGSRGEDAPLSMGASEDAHHRLKALARPAPSQADAVRTRLTAPALPLRIAQGEPLNDYIGTSIELRSAAPGPWHGWLLLVEALPVGAEGSPVPRNLVRNVFQPPWDDARARRYEDARPMQIHEGTRHERLRLVALLQDARGRMRAISQTVCAPEGRSR